jgi:hypothetical protein
MTCEPNGQGQTSKASANMAIDGFSELVITALDKCGLGHRNIAAVSISASDCRSGRRDNGKPRETE